MALPPLAARWLEDAVGPMPVETRAPCAECVMCREPEAPGAPAAGYAFQPGIKCCTYMPVLPSFNVGRILGDDSPELELGRTRIRAAMARGAVATPLGLWPSPAMAARLTGVWQCGGLQPRVVCPYLDREAGGRCSIWREREAMCATWFCRHVDGVAGSRAWSGVLGLLRQCERAVVLHCATELGLERELLGELLNPFLEIRDPADRKLHGYVDDDGAMDPSLRRRVWGSWAGREEAFYIAAAAIASRLGWADLLRLGGVKLELALRQARAARNATSGPPALLVLGAVDRAAAGAGQVDLSAAQTPLDPVRLPLVTAQALERFDGRPLEEACADAGIDAPLLERLVRHGVLVEPDGRDLPPRDRVHGSIAPRDRLRVFRGYRGAEAHARIALDDDGAMAVVLHVDNREVTFDEPDTLSFGQELARHQNGFTAEQAMSWGPAGTRLPWERIHALLEELCEEGILQPAE